MFRMASLFVVEREKPRLMAYLRAALTKAAAASGGGGGGDATTSTPPAEAAFRELVRGLASAELVELPPGGRLHLRTSAVAMTGSVTAASRPPGRGSPPARPPGCGRPLALEPGLAPATPSTSWRPVANH